MTTFLVATIACAILVGLFYYFNSRPVGISAEAVAETLRSLRKGTITDIEWDYFVSVQIADTQLEQVRAAVVSMWKEGSPYLVPGGVDPRDLSPRGAAKLDNLIDAVEQMIDRNC